MKDSCSGEKCLRELDLNINLCQTLHYVTLQNTWNIVHGNFIVLYNVFVAFVELNNNTILAISYISYAEYWIWIGLVRPIPRSSRKCQYRSDTDPEYRIGAPLKKIHQFRVLIKAFLVTKKGTATAVLSRVAKGVVKLRSVVVRATPGHPLAPPLVCPY